MGIFFSLGVVRRGRQPQGKASGEPSGTVRKVALHYGTEDFHCFLYRLLLILLLFIFTGKNHRNDVMLFYDSIK
jgi:hypothetical protein